MKVVCIVGITDCFLKELFWSRIISAFQKQFPGAECVVERIWYWPWEFAKIRAFAAKILDAHDVEGDLILVGHSMGGIIAVSIAEQFKCARVRAVTTFFSPHTFLWGYFARGIGSPLRALRMPVVTFAAVPDHMVWYGRRYPGSIHHVVFSTHRLGPICFGWLRTRIAEATAAAVLQTQA